MLITTENLKCIPVVEKAVQKSDEVGQLLYHTMHQLLQISLSVSPLPTPIFEINCNCMQSYKSLRSRTHTSHARSLTTVTIYTVQTLSFLKTFHPCDLNSRYTTIFPTIGYLFRSQDGKTNQVIWLVHTLKIDTPQAVAEQ